MAICALDKIFILIVKWHNLLQILKHNKISVPDCWFVSGVVLWGKPGL